MEQSRNKKSANREDWLRATLEVLRERGIEGIKVVGIARRMGLTSGSFYWHFANVQDLMNAVLDYWENVLTAHIVDDAQKFSGSPENRILNLMLQVIREEAAVPDGAIAVWAKSDAAAQSVYQRTINQRFEFAKWMFEQVGFSEAEARTRGRLMVTALMGEASNGLRQVPDWEEVIRGIWQILIARTA